MIPFPRQEMQRLKWSPPLIEYFYQLDLLLSSVLSVDDDPAGLANGAVLSSIRSNISNLQDDIEALEQPVSTVGQRGDPEVEHRSLEMRVRRLESRATDLEDLL